ncbi:MAG: poly granule associated [Comamonadaceae bacterium]|nr:MAG: poly granule associated [Comamonadaceae bacterium]
MVTKLKKTTATPKTASKATTKTASKATPDLSNSIKDSAQQIWQAGLGAFMKAQAGGTKAFEALVKEGVTLQRKTQSAAEEKISEATQKMTNMATDITSKASGQWDKLESIFEDRVAKALNKLGVPSAKDVEALMARIDALNASVQKLSPAKTVAKPAVEAAAKPTAKVAKKVTPKAAATPVSTKVASKPAAAAKPAARKPAVRKTPVEAVGVVADQPQANPV